MAVATSLFEFRRQIKACNIWREFYSAMCPTVKAQHAVSKPIKTVLLNWEEKSSRPH